MFVSHVSPVRIRLALSAPQAVRDTSALLFEPQQDVGGSVVVLAPGAGTDLTGAVLRVVGRRVAQAGHPAIVFNFPYTEAGRRRPDPPSRLERAYADVLGAATRRLGGRPLVIGGRSMGGRVASKVAAEDPGACVGLVLLGYPLHPQRRVHDVEPVPAQHLRTGHWPRLSTPLLFVQGDRDRLCDLDVLAREQTAHLDPALLTTHVVAGADHAFTIRRRDPRTASDVLNEVAAVVADWVVDLESARHAGP